MEEAGSAEGFPGTGGVVKAFSKELIFWLSPEHRKGPGINVQPLMNVVSHLSFCLFQFKKYLFILFGSTSLSWDTGNLPSSFHAGLFLFINIYSGCGMWDLVPDQSQLPCIGCRSWPPLDHQGIPPGFT